MVILDLNILRPAEMYSLLTQFLLWALGRVIDQARELELIFVVILSASSKTNKVALFNSNSEKNVHHIPLKERYKWHLDSL